MPRSTAHDQNPEKNMSFPTRSILSAAVATCFGAALAPSDAAGQSPDTDRIARGRNDIDEITVTAAKLHSRSLSEETSTASRLGISALDTPATVQIITGESIRLRGDSDIGAAVTRSVGFVSSTTSGGSGYGVTARGFGSSSVTSLYDGMKSLINIGSQSYPYDTWNVDRIEVLNGPASVLHGNGAIGGAINIIPRKPSGESERTVMLSGGSFGTERAGLDIAGPIGDALAYRLDVSRRVSDGAVALGETDGTAVTAGLAYEVSPTFKLTFSGDHADRTQLNYNGIPLIDNQLDERLRDVNYASSDSEIPFKDQRVHVVAEWQPSEAVTVRNMTYSIDGERLWRYPTRFVYRPATNDIVRSQFGTFSQSQEQFGNHTEVQWRHMLGGLENTVAFGADVNHLENYRFVDNYLQTDVVDLFNTNPGVFPGGPITRNYQRTKADEYSVFAEDRLAMTQRLSVIGGIRADRSEVARDDLVLNTSVEKTFTPVSSRLGVVYEVAPQLNFYAQWATATDSVANLCCVSAAQLDFALSKGEQVEVGVKQIARDGRLEWSAAAYRIVKDNLLTPDPNNLGQSLQIGQQSSQGLEAGVAVAIGSAWRIEANATTLDAVYDDFSEAVAGVLVSRDGNEPINVPQESANVLASWSFGSRWYVQAGLRYVGGFYTTTSNLPQARVPSYTIVDAGLHWTPRPMLDVDLRINNAGDKFYAYTSVNNGNQWVLGLPRYAEMAVTMTF
jgi:iron complex outermembrane recepter protein